MSVMVAVYALVQVATMRRLSDTPR
jgi:hypothetical protein